MKIWSSMKPIQISLFVISIVLFLMQNVYADRESDESDEWKTKFDRFDRFNIDEAPACRFDKHCVFPKICNKRERVCRCPDDHDENGRGNCDPHCPGLSEQCTDCCSEGAECNDNVCTICTNESGENICGPSTIIFATATQIALSVAMLLGVMILISLLYKICTKPHYFPSNHRRATSGEEESHESRSSFQNFFGRLQNRPPQYETEQDYLARQQQQQTAENQAQPQQSTQTTQTPATIPIPSPNVHIGIAPPAYDGNVGDENVLPPPYSMAVIQIDSQTPQSGFVNSAYSSEGEGQIRDPTIKSDTIIVENSSVSHSDKSMHM